MSEKISRRKYLKYVGSGVVVAALAGAGYYYLTSAPPAEISTTTAASTTAATMTSPVVDTEAGVLNVFDWSGYELPEFWAPFKAQHPNVDVKFTTLISTTQASAKLKSGFKPDVVHPCYVGILDFVNGGLIEPLDISQLQPNWDDIWPVLKTGCPPINGNTYMVPQDWGYVSVIARTDLLEKMGISREEYNTWNILWDPRLKGKIAMGSGVIDAICSTSVALGINTLTSSHWDFSPDELQRIKEKLLEQVPLIRTYWSTMTDLANLMKSGEVVVSMGWNDGYALLKKDNVPVEFLPVKEGRLIWICGFCIVTGGNKKLAYDYIKAYTDPQSSANFTNMYYYGTPSMKAVPLMNKDVVENLGLDNPDESFRNAIPYGVIPNMSDLEEVMREVKASAG